MHNHGKPTLQQPDQPEPKLNAPSSPPDPNPSDTPGPQGLPRYTDTFGDASGRQKYRRTCLQEVFVDLGEGVVFVDGFADFFAADAGVDLGGLQAGVA